MVLDAWFSCTSSTLNNIIHANAPYVEYDHEYRRDFEVVAEYGGLSSLIPKSDTTHDMFDDHSLEKDDAGSIDEMDTDVFDSRLTVIKVWMEIPVHQMVSVAPR